MAQQTAVEWLVYNIFQSYMDGKIYCNGLDITEEIEQAKQIEKEQIISAATEMKRELIGNTMFNKEMKFQNGEEYYNKTYNK